MSIFTKNDGIHKAILWIDDRFQIVVQRTAPPPMASAQLTFSVFPITDGEIWDHPYDVFVVDEGRIVELENEMRE